MRIPVITAAFLAALSMILVACGDSSDSRPPSAAPEPEPPTEAQLLLQQFGPGQNYFTEAGMQGLLDFEDDTSPVLLVQLVSVSDQDAFSAYEDEAQTLWAGVGAQVIFASEVFAEVVGDRGMNQVRAIEFANISMLLDALHRNDFPPLMEQLFAATDDHAWVMGVEFKLPIEARGSYFDPALQNLDREQVLELYPWIADANGGFDADTEILIDMLVSDDPSPFYMVNLIEFNEQAQYEDGRDADLTGQQANQRYSDAILPQLIAHNSLPALIVPGPLVLTDESAQWQQLAIARYASRDAFLNIFALNPSGQAALEDKDAGVKTTLVNATTVASETYPSPEDGFLYQVRYCEVLLFSTEGERLRADVYNSLGFGNCPQDEWDALDAEVIAEEFGADLAWLNGIRYWVIDRPQPLGESEGVQLVEQFGEITMRLGASVLLPEGASPADAQGVGYGIAEVSRSTIWHYSGGRQVYRLEDPEGNRYQMQSFSQEVDEDLQLKDLQFLGRRLDLPPGWKFSVHILEEDFQLPTVDGIAEMVADEFRNTYQRIP